MTTETLVDHLAAHLSNQLGRKVSVARYREHVYSRMGGRLTVDPNKGAWRYSIGVEGCAPAMFGPMNVNEAKARLAMLSDMLSSGVIKAGEDRESSRTYEDRPLRVDIAPGASDSY